MRRQRRHDTGPERLVRSSLHRAGLRFRIHSRPLPDHRIEADISFPRAKVLVFIDGCYWHGCPNHGTWPKANAAFWRAKIEGNQARDLATTDLLRDAGWLVVRVWEHEPSGDVAEHVAAVVRGRLVEQSASKSSSGVGHRSFAKRPRPKDGPATMPE
jgi:DNA mismatch endonuclease, patch repair protein